MTDVLPTLHRFDRWGERLGVVVPMGEVVHTETVEGEDVLEFTCKEAVEKGERIVWHDGDFGFREHIAVRTSQGLDGLVHVRAEGSLAELEGDYIEQLYLRDADADQALSSVLAVTRWGLDVQGVANGVITCWLYHVDALSALRKVAEGLGLEISSKLVVDGASVVSRTVVATPRIGGWNFARFDYGRDLAGCCRTVLEEPVVTALYGFGAGLPVVDDYGTWHGGYSRKLTFGNVNGGVNWVGDEDARLAWGRPGADGKSREHVFGEVVFSECEDARELLRLTRAELAKRTVPRVTYVVDVVNIDGCPGLGDDVLVVDPLFAAGRVIERCIRRVRTFGQTLSCELTLGYFEKDLSQVVEELQGRIGSVESSVINVADEVAAVGEEALPADPVPDPDPDPEPAEGDPRARALLLDDGTLEFTYLADGSSQSGGTVSATFDVIACEAFGDLPWKGSSKQITAARFDSSFASAGITSIAYFFYTCSSLASVAGMGYLSGITDMSYAFASCTSLASLDLAGMTLGEGACLKMAFGSCTSLETVTVDASWTLPTVADGYATFYNCKKLVGGNGTAYSSSKISGEYMRVDLEGTEGFLTAG